MTHTSTSSGPASDLPRRRLSQLRQGLLRLHKTLIDSERIAYERTYGRVNSSGEMLQLLTEHRWFAWLRPFSELIVEIDERLDAKEPVTVEDTAAFIERVAHLLKPEIGANSEDLYDAAVQRDPNVAMAHSQISKTLSSA